MHNKNDLDLFSPFIVNFSDVVIENNFNKNNCQKNHQSYFLIAGINILVESDLPIEDFTFNKKFSSFEVDFFGVDTVKIFHHFGIPEIKIEVLGKALYRKPPWAIYHYKNHYIYLGISPNAEDPTLHVIAIFTDNHNISNIYNCEVYKDSWLKGDLASLTLFPTDQILIARLLADRQGCYLHSAGVIINGAGLLFVGHSESGKSTTTNFLIDAAAKGYMELDVLCDDRNIVRFIDKIWQVYGTWSHGDVPIVSGAHAPLRGICFLEQANDNNILLITDHKEIIRRLLSCVIRPFVTADWWTKTLDVIEQIVCHVPCYIMRFDKSGAIVNDIIKIAEI